MRLKKSEKFIVTRIVTENDFIHLEPFNFRRKAVKSKRFPINNFLPCRKTTRDVTSEKWNHINRNLATRNISNEPRKIRPIIIKPIKNITRKRINDVAFEHGIMNFG